MGFCSTNDMSHVARSDGLSNCIVVLKNAAHLVCYLAVLQPARVHLKLPTRD